MGLLVLGAVAVNMPVVTLLHASPFHLAPNLLHKAFPFFRYCC